MSDVIESGGLQERIQQAITNPKNVGELPGADAVGTVGSPDCGDMLRMWIKFKEQDGKRVIDRATFQTFGCETAIAVASVATELISGKTAEEALNLSGADLSAPLGALPPMKIHCAQLVEGALRSALSQGSDNSFGDKSPAPAATPDTSTKQAPSLLEQFGGEAAKKVKIVLK